jgi:hypothetical protein
MRSVKEEWSTLGHSGGSADPDWSAAYANVASTATAANSSASAGCSKWVMVSASSLTTSLRGTESCTVRDMTPDETYHTNTTYHTNKHNAWAPATSC